MAITQAEIKTTAKLLVGVGALAGAPGVGTANTVIGIGTSLMDLYAGRRPETGWETKVTEALEAKLAAPDFHRPASADRLLPQLIEFGLPSPEDLTGEGWDANRIARLMRNCVPERSSDPAHADAVLLDAFEVWVSSGLAPLLDDPTFVSEQAGLITREMFERFETLQAGQDSLHDKIDEILRRMGGGEAALAEVEALSLKELETLAAGFGEAPGRGKAELIQFLDLKAQEYASFQAQIDLIDERTAGLGNLKAAAKDAAERLDFGEVETLLARVDEVETEIAAQTKELRADNALLRGRVEEAYRLLSAAADSFGSVSPTEPARKAILTYFAKLRGHGLRYGGIGVLKGLDLLDGYVNDALFQKDAWLWAAGQNARAVGLQNQGSRTGGESGAATLAEAVAGYRAALRVYTEADYPMQWAMTQNNLGTALSDQGSRTGGEAGAALLADAVTAYRAALRVYTEADHPVNWAMIQNNLGNALADQGVRTGGAEGAALQSDAVAAFRAALRVYTEADHPVDWAMTQNNLGNALAEQGSRTGGEEGAALLAEAAAAYRAALRVRTEADHPVQFAMTMENIALTEEAISAHEKCDDPAAHLEAALDTVTAALRVFDPEDMAYNHEKAAALKTRLEAKLAELEGGSD